MSSADHAHRSYLFAPGTSPSVMRKAMASDADAVILDLEDAVASDRKSDARREVSRMLEEIAASSSSRAPAVHVRVNLLASGYDPEDLAVAVHPTVEAIRLPKAESPDDIRAASVTVRDLESQRGLPGGTIGFYPTIESARGVMAAQAIAASDPRIRRLVLGQADLVADLGAHGDDALTTTVPRALLALASRAAGIDAPVDGATTDLDDASVLTEALHRARALGFHGKSAIHPRQIPAIHATFTPSADELASAARIVRAAEAAGGGATVLDGQMIDTAVVRRAKGLLGLRREP